MTLNVNQSLNSTASLSRVFAGTDPRLAQSRSGQAAELPQGSGIRASSALIDQLDDARRQQTQFENNTSRRAQRAVDAYQSLANEQRRSDVQSLLGVDVYA